MSRAKKPRLDFGNLVAGSQAVRTNAQLLQQKAKDFTTAVRICYMDQSIFQSIDRICGLCDEETVQLVLVSRLGLDGLEALRSAMQTVPVAFLGKRTSVVTQLVNSVLQSSKRECISEEECNSLMSICSSKCKGYMKREACEQAFESEQYELTLASGRGFSGFLAPPVTYCLNQSCGRQNLVACSYGLINVTLFTLDGPRPASKISLKCPKCSTSYGYATYGKKLSTGVRFYDEERKYVEASDAVFIDRKLCHLFACLSMHCWVSFCGFTEVMFEVWHTEKLHQLSMKLKDHKFCTQMSRKHISSAFFNDELEKELGETHQKAVTFFKCDDDKNIVMARVETQRATKRYAHVVSPSCEKKGCGRCWSFDGNWKLGFTHCMYPVKTSVQGLPQLNFPNVCTEEPQFTMAFCKYHCVIARSKGIPTDLNKYLQYQKSAGCTEPPPDEARLDHHPIAQAQGTESFMKDHPSVAELCETVSTPTCNKDTGDGAKLRMWSRGHFFIVRPCGHIDQWHPIYRSESPSQAFIIILTWLLETLRDIPESKWSEVILSYDNMCHLDAMRAAQADLPLPSPYNHMWKSVTKVIDDLHIKNHRDEKCQSLYHPKQVKEKNPDLNLMCAEQVFTWLSRFKKITCAMNKTHHCFFIHRIVTRRNKYSELCAQLDRSPLLPSIH